MSSHPEHGLGRLKAPDARDRAFRMAATLPTIPKAPKPRVQPYHLGQTLDQGKTAQCVGHAGRHKLMAAPIMVPLNVGATAFELYKGAQVHDEWPGESYEGTSVRGLFKFMQSMRYLTSYVWAEHAADCHKFLHDGWGTIVCGTEWTTAMFTPDAKGFVHPEGPTEGGHAYHLFWSIDRGEPGTSELWFQNSWGTGWGLTLARTAGCFKMTWADFDYLLIHLSGEAGAGIEHKVPPTV